MLRATPAVDTSDVSISRSFVALAALAVSCCGSAEATAPAPALYALLADNRLLALDSDARVLYRLRLGPVEREPSMGPHLVLAPGGRLLYVLVQGSARSGDSV